MGTRGIEAYILFNFLEKSKSYLYNHTLSKKVLIGLNPILPRLTSKIFLKLFKKQISEYAWPQINELLLINKNLELPIQIQGKLITTISTQKGYDESDIMKRVYQLDKIKSRILSKEIVKIINVQDKIINIITD